MSVSEGTSAASSAVFTVSLASTTSENVVVYYETIDGTATSDSDYTSVEGSITISAGESMATIVVPVNADSDHESDETFFLRFTEATSSSVGSEGLAVGTIGNDDSATPLQLVSIDPLPIIMSESNPTIGASFVVRRDSSVGDLTVSYLMSGSADVGYDYSGPSASNVVIPNGSTSATVSVFPIDDSEEDGWEDIHLQLLSGSDYQTNPTSNQAQIFIEDNDTSSGPLVTVSADRSTISEEDLATPVVFTFFRQDASASATIQFSIGGDATNGIHYEHATNHTSISDTVSFSVGQSIATIPVVALDDGETDQDTTLTFSVAEAIIGGSAAFASVLIYNRPSSCARYPFQGFAPQNCEPVPMTPTNSSSSMGTLATINEMEVFEKYFNTEAAQAATATITDDFYAHEVNWGDGTMDLYAPGDRAAHLYPDDAPAGTPQDDYTVTIRSFRRNNTVHTWTGTITVKNVRPIANEDLASTDEDHAIVIDALANDTDISYFDTLVIADWSADAGTLGELTHIGNGLFRYDPRGHLDQLSLGQSHTARFTYRIHDGDDLVNTVAGMIEVAVAGKKEVYYAEYESMPAKEEGQVAGQLKVTINPPAKAGGVRLQWAVADSGGNSHFADPDDFVGATSGEVEIAEGDSIGYITLIPVDDEKPELDEIAKISLSLSEADEQAFAINLENAAVEIWDNEWRWDNVAGPGEDGLLVTINGNAVDIPDLLPLNDNDEWSGIGRIWITQTTTQVKIKFEAISTYTDIRPIGFEDVDYVHESSGYFTFDINPVDGSIVPGGPGITTRGSAKAIALSDLQLAGDLDRLDNKIVQPIVMGIGVGFQGTLTGTAGGGISWSVTSENGQRALQSPILKALVGKKGNR